MKNLLLKNLEMRGARLLEKKELKSIIGGEPPLEDGFICASVYRYCDREWPNDLEIFNACMEEVFC